MFNEERPREPRPLIRSEMLHVVYFPELKEPFSTFFIAVSDYNIWIGEGAKYKTTLTSGFGDEYNRGLEKVYEAMLNASNVLMEHVSRLMKTLA